MNEQPLSRVLETSFQIDSIVPVSDPTGGPDPWYRYVISQGPGAANAIVGTRPGTLANVNAQLLQMVDQLNDRFGRTQQKKKK
jgi:hypothetical protein